MKALSKNQVALFDHIITRAMACEAIALMDEWKPPEPQLKIEDYVVVIKSDIPELVGRYGKITSYYASVFEVEFAQGYYGGSCVPSLHVRTLDAGMLRKVP